MTFTQIKAKLDAYERLIRLDKPVGFLLLMWPTLWGLWMAAYGAPDIGLVFIFCARDHPHALGRLRHQRLGGSRI